MIFQQLLEPKIMKTDTFARGLVHIATQKPQVQPDFKPEGHTRVQSQACLL